MSDPFFFANLKQVFYSIDRSYFAACRVLIYIQILLAPANEVWGKVMFYSCVSFCSRNGVHPPSRQTSPRQTQPPEMVTEAGGTHRTGMHSCLVRVLPGVSYGT